MDSAQNNTNTTITNEHADTGNSEVKKKWLAIAYAALVLLFAAGFWLSDANSYEMIPSAPATNSLI